MTHWYPHLNRIEFPRPKDLHETILISTDHTDLLLHREFRLGRYRESMEVNSKLGWVVIGGSKLNEREGNKGNVIFFVMTLVVPATGLQPTTT